MRLIKVSILLACLAFSKGSNAQRLNDSVFLPEPLMSCKLISATNGKITTLKSRSFSEPLLLFVFLSPDCPLCKNYSPVLNDLQKKFGGNVKIMGIVPGKTYPAKEVKAFATKYKLGFPLFIDPQKKLTTLLQGAVTPEALLLDANYHLVYKGAIDNRVKQLGVNRWKATENYLSDAITQYLQYSPVAVKRVKAIGCLINDF